jgi:hypothetical protein
MRKWWKGCRRDSWLRILRFLHAHVRMSVRERGTVPGSMFRPRETSGVQTPQPCALESQVSMRCRMSTKHKHVARGDSSTNSTGKVVSGIRPWSQLKNSEAKRCRSQTTRSAQRLTEQVRTSIDTTHTSTYRSKRNDVEGKDS